MLQIRRGQGPSLKGQDSAGRGLKEELGLGGHPWGPRLDHHTGGGWLPLVCEWGDQLKKPRFGKLLRRLSWATWAKGG